MDANARDAGHAFDAGDAAIPNLYANNRHTEINVNFVSRFLLAAALALSASACLAGVPSITLRNSLDRTVKIELLADQRAANGESPKGFVVQRGKTVTIQLQKEGPFEVNVRPQDNSGTLAPFRLDLRHLREWPTESRLILRVYSKPYSTINQI